MLRACGAMARSRYKAIQTQSDCRTPLRMLLGRMIATLAATLTRRRRRLSLRSAAAAKAAAKGAERARQQRQKNPSSSTCRLLTQISTSQLALSTWAPTTCRRLAAHSIISRSIVSRGNGICRSMQAKRSWRSVSKTPRAARAVDMSCGKGSGDRRSGVKKAGRGASGGC